MDCSSLFGGILFAIAIGYLAWAACDAAYALGANGLATKGLRKGANKKEVQTLRRQIAGAGPVAPAFAISQCRLAENSRA